MARSCPAMSRSSTAWSTRSACRARCSGLAAPGFVDLQVNGFAGVDRPTADAAGYARVGEALLETGTTAFQPTFVTAPEAVLVAALRTLAALPGGPTGGGGAPPATPGSGGPTRRHARFGGPTRRHARSGYAAATPGLGDPRAATSGSGDPRAATLGPLAATPGPRVLGAHLEGPFLSRPARLGAHDPRPPPRRPISPSCAACSPPARSAHVTLAPELPARLSA